MTPLEEFLRAWLDWVDAGAPERDPFSRSQGLCIASMHFMDYNMAVRFAVMNALPVVDEGSASPFGSYLDDTETRSIHLNSARLAWVRETIARLASEREAAA